MKIYFAGPDIFRRDYPAVVAEIRGLCSGRGITALVPEDDGLADAREIYRKNIGLIREADGVIANLDPFRGPAEPDSGTVFEVGFARALGKWVIVRLTDGRTYHEKLNGTPQGPQAPGSLCPDGTAVEDFGLPLNIMPYFAADIIARTLAEAVEKAGPLNDRHVPLA
ncbi:MAG: nucleoside 2-deoxyribosyltransferase [Deltaproteobacteria bacterium]|jgi:nucleoside 2-deoxyribosyltransferase|nr:nucleoside 2-deoxyribosyltransferase [Deltaproteobacteria bacterium]